MPSPFDNLDGALSRAVMGVFGETVAASLRPRTISEYADGADPDRPARDIRGVFTEAHDVAQPRGAAMGSEFSGVTRIAVHQAEFFITAADLAAVPYAIRQKDRLAFPGRAGAPVYSIADMQRGDTGDLNLLLVSGD